jgi:hypothetical protein
MFASISRTSLWLADWLARGLLLPRSTFNHSVYHILHLLSEPPEHPSTCHRNWKRKNCPRSWFSRRPGWKACPLRVGLRCTLFFINKVSIYCSEKFFALLRLGLSSLAGLETSRESISCTSSHPSTSTRFVLL